MTISWIVFACGFGGAVLGLVLRRLLPERHLSQESRDVVKLGVGLIATMAALVLGLLIASAKGSFDAQRNELGQMSSNIILLDRMLAHYGPETQETRKLLRQSVVQAIERIWPEDRSRPAQVHGTVESEALFEKIQALSPKNDAQRSLQGLALKSGTDIAQTRWLLFTQRDSSIPTPFLVVLVFWLTMIFVSFGLFAQPNATVITTLLVCALAVSSAIFLVLELDRALDA